MALACIRSLRDEHSDARRLDIRRIARCAAEVGSADGAAPHGGVNANGSSKCRTVPRKSGAAAFDIEHRRSALDVRDRQAGSDARGTCARAHAGRLGTVECLYSLTAEASDERLQQAALLLGVPVSDHPPTAGRSLRAGPLLQCASEPTAPGEADVVCD